MNIDLIEDQPRWRVLLVAWFAKLVGVLFHVEGLPFGSGRNISNPARDTSGAGVVGLSPSIAGSAAVERSTFISQEG